MSGSVGSAFGRGPFGSGPYSRNPRSDGSLVIPAASRISVRIEPWRTGQLSIPAAGVVAVIGTLLWEKLAIPPCQPWTMIAQGGCYRALANSAGAMFP